MSPEERKYERLSFQGRVFIELLAPGVDATEGEVVACTATDISRSGLRVCLGRELTVGAILQIGAEVPQQEDTLYLAGEVKWCRQDGSATEIWSVGFELLNASDSDIESWRSILTDLDGREPAETPGQ